jgi:hypothetical protein
VPFTSGSVLCLDVLAACLLPRRRFGEAGFGATGGIRGVVRPLIDVPRWHIAVASLLCHGVLTIDVHVHTSVNVMLWRGRETMPRREAASERLPAFMFLLDSILEELLRLDMK